MTPRSRRAAELSKLLSERDYWRDLASAVGWTLQGWTDRKERDDILRAIRRPAV